MPSAADSDLPNQTPPETIAPTGSTSHSTAGAGLPTPIDGETSPPVEQTAGAEGDDEFLDYEPLTPELLEEEAIRGDFALRWAVVLLTLVLGSTKIAEPRTLLHVKTGEYLAQHGWLPPANDVFSATIADRPWTNLSWGFDLMVYGLHHLTGATASLSLFKALLAAFSFGLLVHISRPGVSSWWGSICAATALIACLPQLTVEPQVMTILGTSLLLWILHSAQVSGVSGSKKLWLLIPVFFVWANLDPRAWLGLFLLLLYTLGCQIEQSLRRAPANGSSEANGLSAGTLWTVTIASIAVAAVHPFLFRSLSSPFAIYGHDYPALRDYFQQLYLQQPSMPSTGIPYFPLYAEHFWRSPDPAGIVGVVLMAAAGAALILNWSQMEIRWLLVYLGAVALSFMAARELPVCSLVFCVVAALNGQAWFQSEFRQSYAVETGEILFSRGGRAATVVLLFVLAFLGLTGRLSRGDVARFGYGLDPDLENVLQSMSTQLSDSLDERPFNMLPAHGDLIIYLNQKPFIDSRLPLYAGTGQQENLLNTYVTLRDQLQKPGNREWRKGFNEWGVTHTVVRMGKNPDFKSLYTLLGNPGWQLTRFGAAAAVFYLVDDTNPKLTNYLKSRNVAFIDDAFWKAKPLDLRHEHDIAPPTFYEKYMWSRKRDVPNDIQEALHLARMASDVDQPNFSPSLALLAIRRAHEGLRQNPDSPEGYLALGMAYRYLAIFENQTVMVRRQPLTANLRYFQAIAAFNQVLVAEPLNRFALIELRNLYGAAGRADLQLRVVESLDKAFLEQKFLRLTKEQVDELDMQYSYTVQLKNQLQPLSDKMDEEIAARVSKSYSILQIADFCLQNGYILKALDQLDKAQEIMAGNPEAQQKRIGLMLEAGRISEATEAAGYFEQTARSRGLPNWQFTVATACLPAGNFETAVRFLGEAVDDQSRQGMSRLIQSLQVRPSINAIQPWPINATSTTLERARDMPHVIADARLKTALIQIERADLVAARRNLEAILEDNPDFVERPLVVYYLSMLTRQRIDRDPPSLQVPVLFEKSDQPAAAKPVDPAPAKPAEPAAVKPTEPAAVTKPAQPAPAKPAEPAAKTETPAPAKKTEPAAPKADVPSKK